MQNLMDECELAEMRSSGVYYSWSNKTIQGRIGRALYNQYWHTTFDFTHLITWPTACLTIPLCVCNSLLHQKLDQASNTVICGVCTWIFFEISSFALPTPESATTLSLTGSYLSVLTPKLSELDRDNFKDLRQQVKIAVSYTHLTLPTKRIV